MIGVQDFIGYYDWTFEYLRRNYGEEALRDYWLRGISQDSQRHARELIEAKGFEGMREYWAYTLAEEEAGYTIQQTEDYFRIDMFNCPSKGHLIQRGLRAYHDYCEHCMAWVGPMLEEAGFTADTEHNHRGQCYLEIHRRENPSSEPPPDRGPDDVRRLPNCGSRRTTFILTANHSTMIRPRRTRRITHDADQERDRLAF